MKSIFLRPTIVQFLLTKNWAPTVLANMVVTVVTSARLNHLRNFLEKSFMAITIPFILFFYQNGMSNLNINIVFIKLKKTKNYILKRIK